MPYILKKTNGTTLTTVQDASVDNSTSLTFVGRNYSGYGQPVEENLVKLLESFANLNFEKKSSHERKLSINYRLCSVGVVAAMFFLMVFTIYKGDFEDCDDSAGMGVDVRSMRTDGDAV